MQDNKRKKTDLTITALLLVGILAVVNFFASNIFFRWDLTQEKIYSISPASRKTVADLDDIVNIKAYFSENLPPVFAMQKQEAADILNEYQVYSDGKVRVEFIDPKEDQNLQQKLYMLGIPQLTFDVRDKDEMKLSSGYLGIAISYADKTEVIPALKNGTSDLEYQITTAIKKAVSDELATIGYLSGQGTMDNGSMSTALGEIEKLYSLQAVELSEDATEVPSGISTLLIIRPEEDFTEEQFKILNSFLKRGGSIFVMADGVKIGDGLMATKATGNIGSFLEKYGLRIAGNIVADSGSNGIARFSQGFFTFSSNYPFWPVVTNAKFNKDFGAVANLESVLLPWASEIEILEPESPGIIKLAVTTESAWSQAERYNVVPSMNITPSGMQKERVLAAALIGEVEDPYSDDGSKFNARIIAVGDSDFLTDGFIQNSPDNLNFFQNLVDSLSFDESLMSIRSKGATSRPIEKELSQSSKTMIKYSNILGVTFLVIVFGTARYFARRKSRFVDDI